MSLLNLVSYQSQAALVERVSSRVAERLARSVKERGCGTLIATGGTAAPTVYKDLSRRSLAWNKVNIFLSDERFVHADHEASNARVVRETLLQNEAAAASFHPFDQTQPNAARAAEYFNATYTNGLVADCAVLGIGADLHVASIFPAGSGMGEALTGTCLAVPTTPNPLPLGAPFARISLTMHTMAQTREVHFVLYGDAKRETLEGATINGETPPAVVLLQRLGRKAWVHCGPDDKGERT